MKSIEDYRTIAENCMRQADAAQDERDRPLWATMAQSWLRLAEHRERINNGFSIVTPIDLDEAAQEDRTSSFA